MVYKTVDHGKLWSICKLSHLKWLLGGTYMYGNYAIQGRKLRCCLGVNSKLIVFLVFFWNLLRLICNCLSCNYHWMIIIIFSFKFVFLQFTSSPFQVPFLIMIVVNTLFFLHFQSSDLFLFMVGQLQKYMPHSPRRSSSRRKGSNREDELE